MRTVQRAKVSQDLWDTYIGKKDKELVLVTSDFAMKLLPRSAREKQTDFFGKKGTGPFINHVCTRGKGGL